MQYVKYLPVGDSAVSVELGDEINEVINRRVQTLKLTLEDKRLNGLTEFIPTYRSLLVCYDPAILQYSEVLEQLDYQVKNVDESLVEQCEVIEVPVLYGGEYGPDLKNVARHCKISEEEVIRIHSSGRYLIYMLGFTPGFMYLGGMNDRIATPRLKTPRVKIPAGSVGIAGIQTGIYPIESPGGWQLIGRTPLQLFDIRRKNPFFMKAGQYVKFNPVDRNTFTRIKEEVETGSYNVNVMIKGE